ncbi:hypothetical protein [Halobacteriovorax sp. RT-2-6]|uniref:hypothetical protein n=1 Tax=unclassified Halobacteriovorax TaxID=2639665 RepID=UPI003999F38E
MAKNDFSKFRNIILSVMAVILWVAMISYLYIEHENRSRIPASMKDNDSKQRPHRLYRN